MEGLLMRLMALCFTVYLQIYEDNLINQIFLQFFLLLDKQFICTFIVGIVLPVNPLLRAFTEGVLSSIGEVPLLSLLGRGILFYLLLLCKDSSSMGLVYSGKAWGQTK